MANTLIFGHKNPDTDTISSAIVYSYLKNKLGLDTEPVRLGNINEETQYVLDYFNIEAPRLVTNVAEEVSEVILVDHNEHQQSADGIDKVKVLEVIDHHRIANFETADPLYYRAEPVGCTATILNKLFKEHGVEIPREMAGLMLSAIISDTLLFKSPTCTNEDVQAANELGEIAQMSIEEYGLNMLRAGADLSGKTMKELISLDSKEFALGDSKVEVAQVNTVDVNDVLQHQEELTTEITSVVAEKQLDLFVLVVTDILNNDSTVLPVGHASSAVEQAFGVKLTDQTAVLKGVVSRKKQIVPFLTKALS
ncbi:manganese-dependent inorganic pyrophosphatase [Pseudalkalibacillus decolorationis]|uniref:manganese-dependent inorganic pyrophosphatase n=1 Tax=Pseudalkalibacillus decolorationis TaxID=163879 RepID=UPI002148D784|nr:manganese-dependent inorganic pyrophosphatase [Pseudalkalibacillus decolorationis]